ncbi:hypothetical protein KR038_001077, partial [Drosophila bunnanda]
WDPFADLKAFERRLTEVVSSYRPSTFRWRSKYLLPQRQAGAPWSVITVELLAVVLSAMSMCTAISAWYWLRDPRTTIVPLTESLFIHPIFTIATLALIVLFTLGIQKLVIAPQIITSRTRTVLGDFNMSCDDTGKLILKPRQSNNNST